MNTGRQFGPMKKDNPSLGQPCPACDEVFKEGCYTTLIPIGPGSDEENQRLCREGRPYNDVAILVHYQCATGYTPIPEKK
jgi:hypothetical protein